MRIHKPVSIYLLCIVLLAFAVRFWHLGINPVGFHRDEAFLGYNAYSLLKTGSDMSGNRMPIHLQSFFWSPAGYSYASIPFIWIFGLSEFSSRFASALFGSLGVIATFFLVSLMLRLEIPKSDTTSQIARSIALSDAVSLLSTFVIAVSPWHINASRIGIEITLVVFLLTIAVISFFLYLKSKQVALLITTFVLFAVTFTVYQAPRAFVPLLIPLLFFLYRQYVSRKHLIVATLLYVAVILLPIAIVMTSPILSLRIQSLSIFKSPQAQLKIDEAIREDGMNKKPAFVARMLHNKAVGYTNEIVNNYVSHFSFDFLFRDKGFPTRMTIFGAGNMHTVELLFLILGIYMIVRRRSRYHILVGLWILFAPIGSSLTYDDVPNMQRTLLIQPALGIAVALGIYALTSRISEKKYLAIPVILLAFLYIFNIAQYLDAYYIHQPTQGAQFRNAGYKELVREVEGIQNRYNRVVITNAESAPSVFFLFYTSYDPGLYQRESRHVDKNKSDSINFASYVFESEDCPLNRRLGMKKGIEHQPRQLSPVDAMSLYVQFRNCDVATQSSELLHTVRLPNGQEVFQMLKTK